MQAQNRSVPDEDDFCLKIDVKKGTKIKMNFKGSGKAWVVKGDYGHIEEEDLGSSVDWDDLEEYTVSGAGPWIKIYAENLHGILIMDNGNHGDILGADFSKIPSTLTTIIVHHSGYISACTYDQMFLSLPARTGGNSAFFVSVSGIEPNDGAKKSTTSIATGKGWQMLKYEGGATFSGDGTGCAKDYGLRIAGVEVSNTNCTDLSGLSGVSGTVSFDPFTGTLTLDNAKIESSSTACIWNESIDDLKIELIGTCSLECSASNFSALYSKKNMTIDGGKVDVTQTTEAVSAIGIADGRTLRINDCVISASGKHAIYSSNGSGGSLVIMNSQVRATGKNAPSFYNIKEMTLTDCGIKSPKGAKFDASKKTVVDASGKPVKTEVFIQPPVEYDLGIAGKPVTDLNCNDLSVIPGVSGTVKYDHSSKTLTLDNAKIESSSHCIWNNSNGLKIVLKGTNELKKSGAFSALFAKENMTITGGGTLNATHTTGVEGSGIAISKDKTLTISNCTVNASGKYGIYCNNTDGAKLVIENATVKAKGKDNPSFYRIKKLSLTGCEITSPAGAKFDASKKTVVDASGNPVKTEVVIEPPVKEYGLQIAGTEVTNKNCNDLTVIPGVSGTAVKYDNASKTLTLDKAKIEVLPGRHCIWNKSIDGLKIELTGTNEIKGGGNISTLFLVHNMTITGEGTLNVTNNTTGNGSAIGISGGKTLTIANCTVNVAGRKYGIYANGGNFNLVIDKATVKVMGKDAASLHRIKKLTLTGCEITSPVGAVFDASKESVVDASGNPIKEEVVIRPVVEYGLQIAGVKVTDLNCNDLTVIPGVSGTAVQYDPATKTLTLNNAKIESSNLQCILNKSNENLKIQLIGTNTLEMTGNISALYAKQVTKITGGGTLNIIQNGTGGAVSILGPHVLTIHDCTVNASGKYGIRGLASSSNKTPVLIIENAIVKATGGEDGSIHNIKALNLIACSITSPTGAKFDASKKAVVDASGNIIKEEVVIAPPVEYGLQIAGVKVTDLNCNDLTVIPGVSGTAVQYDHATKTLTLNNAKIEYSTTNNCIFNESIDGLKIKLIGTNELKKNSAVGSALYSGENMTIIGEGTLNATHITGEASGIGVGKGKTLTISNCTVNASGEYGIYASTSPATLVIENATVKAKGKDNPSFYRIKEMSLVDCEITTPAGAVFDASKKSVVDASGNPTNEEVVIEPTSTTGIQDLNASAVSLYPNPAEGQFFVEVPASGKLEIINLAGQKVQEF
ncbi:MAG: hypothetical protein CSB06_00580, partial [Bacteroidia bacterium]